MGVESPRSSSASLILASILAPLQDTPPPVPPQPLHKAALGGHTLLIGHGRKRGQPRTRWAPERWQASPGLPLPSARFRQAHRTNEAACGLATEHQIRRPTHRVVRRQRVGHAHPQTVRAHTPGLSQRKPERVP